MSARYLKQYGLPRSGTNYTRWLIEQNLIEVRVLQNIFGKKHRAYDPHAAELPVEHWTRADSLKTDLTHGEIADARQQLLAGKMIHVATMKPLVWYLWSRSRHRRGFSLDDDSAVSSHIRRYNEINLTYIRDMPGPCLVLNYERIEDVWDSVLEFFERNQIRANPIQQLKYNLKFGPNVDKATLKTVGSLDGFEAFDPLRLDESWRNRVTAMTDPTIAAVLEEGRLMKP